MDWDTTAGLPAERLARLLALNFDPELEAGHDHRAETAGQLLDAYLPSASVSAAVAREAAQSSQGGPPPSLGEVLLDPRSSVEVITEIKRYGKRVAAQASSDAERAVATTIYFAAIANGLVVHHRKLTASPYEELHTALDELLDKPWMSPGLRPLLEKAREVCRARKASA